MIATFRSFPLVLWDRNCKSNRSQQERKHPTRSSGREDARISRTFLCDALRRQLAVSSRSDLGHVCPILLWQTFEKSLEKFCNGGDVQGQMNKTVELQTDTDRTKPSNIHVVVCRTTHGTCIETASLIERTRMSDQLSWSDARSLRIP